MKTTMKATVLFSMLLILSIACSKDDDDTPTINATNFSTIIDENPADNTSLGTISAAGTGTLSYSISSQTPNGAMSINATTGELTVANASLFDFETNPNIDAVITILNTEAITTVNATINLNNIDDIASFLSTSKTAYTNTSDGNWVEVTETEYNNLASNLNEVSKAGTTDAEYTTTVSSASGSTGHTRANITTTATIPNGGYLFAFKYKVSFQQNSIAGFKVKQSSTANNDGFFDIGAALPNHSTSINNSDVFFVLKGNNTSVSATGYLAIYNNISLISLIEDTNNIGYYYISGDAQTLSGGISTSWRSLYQGLSTTQKQWE